MSLNEQLKANVGSPLAASLHNTLHDSYNNGNGKAALLSPQGTAYDGGIKPSSDLHFLRKQIAVKNTYAFLALLDIMNGTFKRTKEDQMEATYILFLYSYQYGNMEVGKRAMEILFREISNPIFQKYYSDLLLNVAFYALPINVQIKHNLKQRLFRDLSNLNPFLFRDTLTNDYIVGSRIMNLSRNRGSDYEIYVFSNEGFLLYNFALKYQFDYKRFNRLGATAGVEDVRVINYPTLAPELITNTNIGENVSKQIKQPRVKTDPKRVRDRDNVKGAETVITVKDRDKFLAVGTTMDTHAEGIIKMSMFDLCVERDSKKHICNITGKNLVPLKGYEDDKRQKNWLPFFHQEELFFACKYDPLTILKYEPNVETGGEKSEGSGYIGGNMKNGNGENGLMKIYSVDTKRVEVKANANPVSNLVVTKNKNEGKDKGKGVKKDIFETTFDSVEPLGKARGSIPPISYNGKWLFMVHYSETKHKKYYHRFVEMELIEARSDNSAGGSSSRESVEEDHTNEVEDGELNEINDRENVFSVSRISRVFYFEKSHTIEFGINMIPHTEPDGEQGVLISYGVADKVSRVSFLSFYDIEKSFSQLSTF